MRLIGCWLLIIALLAGPMVAQAQDFDDEGLTDEDLSINLEGETLPEDGLPYHWENFVFRARRLFTFTLEKKAELDRQRLHALDKKAAACAEIGNEECVERVDSRVEKLEEMAAERDKKFEIWREKRQERIEQLKERAETRSGNSDKFRQEFMDKRSGKRPPGRYGVVKDKLDTARERADKRQERLERNIAE